MDHIAIIKPDIAIIASPDKPSGIEISIGGLLKKFSDNGSSLLFSGTFVYLFEDSLQTLKVIRDINDNGEVVEHFIPLDSDQKQSSRHLANQYCTLDNGWRYQFHATSSSFPFRINNHYRELQKNYDFKLIGSKSVAGTRAIGVSVKAKDAYRYSYHLWFEPDTGTLLKYKLLDNNNRLIEQYLFTDIQFTSAVDTPLLPVAAAQIKPCSEEFKGVSSEFKHYFNISQIPEGYQPVSFRKGIINQGTLQAYQFQLSDGIASVSIFIEETAQQQGAVNGVVKLGPVNVAGKTVADHQVTVLGVIPVVSALDFLKAVKEPLND